MCILKLPDFDTLRELHDKDPEALETLRRDHINAIIDNTHPQLRRRLRGLQFQIDAYLLMKPNNVSRCVFISNLMRKSFQELLAAIHEPLENNPSPTHGQTSPSITENTAVILPFKPRAPAE